MKLACLSDIHGNITALEAVLADLDSIGGADQMWILGDIAAMGPRPVEAIRRVKGLVDAVKDDELKKGTVRVISGNTDRYLVYGTHPVFQKPAENVEQLDALRNFVPKKMLTWGLDQLEYEDYEFLAKLPGEVDLRAPHYGYVIGYHAVPGDDEAMLMPDTPDEQAADHFLDREGRLGIGGHIHRQYDRFLSLGGWRIVNDGSVGLSFDKPGYAQWAMIVFDAGDAHVDLRAVPFDVDAVVTDARAVGHPAVDWLDDALHNGRS